MQGVARQVQGGGQRTVKPSIVHEKKDIIEEFVERTSRQLPQMKLITERWSGEQKWTLLLTRLLRRWLGGQMAARRATRGQFVLERMTSPHRQPPRSSHPSPARRAGLVGSCPLTPSIHVFRVKSVTEKVLSVTDKTFSMTETGGGPAGEKPASGTSQYRPPRQSKKPIRDKVACRVERVPCLMERVVCLVERVACLRPGHRACEQARRHT